MSRLLWVKKLSTQKDKFVLGPNPLLTLRLLQLPRCLQTISLQDFLRGEIITLWLEKRKGKEIHHLQVTLNPPNSSSQLQQK